jgi:D-alanyl-D-alanine dipeptidase
VSGPVALLALLVAGVPQAHPTERCAECHPQAARAWEGSGHAASWSSPLFQAGLAVERRQFCVDCHAPAGAEARAGGIGCDSCHAAGATRAALRAPDFCRRCHEFATPEWSGGQMRITELPMQSTFTEWEAYRRAGGAGTCQSCHMPGGDHAMAGAHDVELVRRSIDVAAAPSADGRAVTFALSSAGVGHRFPTGDLFRHLTLEVRDGGPGDGDGGWRSVARVGRSFETRMDGATLAAHKVEIANTTLVPGEPRLVTVDMGDGRGAPLAWRLRYHYGSERDELQARASYDLLVVTLREGEVAAGKPAAPALVDVKEVAPDVAVDIRYASADNFLGRPARGYGAARCLLTPAAAAALGRVQREVAAFGLGLLVYDCYRPQRAVDDFVAWSRQFDVQGDPGHRPAVPKAQLLARGYIAARSSHSRGSTVDVTLVPLGARRPAPDPAILLTDPRNPSSLRRPDCRRIEGPLAPDGSLNMGTTFDCFDERSHAEDAFAPPEARRNRLLLRLAMEKQGFVPYAKEWWHFTLGSEPYPDTTFDLEITRAGP